LNLSSRAVPCTARAPTPVDEQVVVDGQFTTSRSPADLPAFCPAIVEQFAGGRVPS
jgi:putative intracellular protease/amidase